ARMTPRSSRQLRALGMTEAVLSGASMATSSRASFMNSGGNVSWRGAPYARAIASGSDCAIKDPANETAHMMAVALENKSLCEELFMTSHLTPVGLRQPTPIVVFDR